MSKSPAVSRKRTILEPNPKIVCEKCEISFTQRKSLYCHLRRFHPEQDVVLKANQVCGLCSAALRTIALLHEHIQKQHSIELQFTNETFYSQKEFLDWKTKIEKTNKSIFILRNIANKKESGRKLSYYLCHRSGKFKPKEDRRRPMKACGTIKSGSTCPAVMKVFSQTVDGVSEIKVQYQSIHVGHDLEIRTLRLSKDERTTLAALLSFGVPMTKILEETKQNFTPANRYNRLTRKDLQNIVRDFGVPKKGEETKQSSATTNNAVIYENSVVIYDDDGVIYEGEDAVYEDSIATEINNSDDRLVDVNNRIQEQNLEKSTIVSSVLKSHSEDLSFRKIQIVNKLKELQLRIQEWDEARPLPDIEKSISDIDVCLDIASQLEKSQTVTAKTSSKKFLSKQRKCASK